MLKRRQVKNDMKNVQMLMLDEFQFRLMMMISVVSVNAREGTAEMENYMQGNYFAGVRSAPPSKMPGRYRQALLAVLAGVVECLVMWVC